MFPLVKGEKALVGSCNGDVSVGVRAEFGEFWEIIF
jgi:hypothetical protein